MEAVEFAGHQQLDNLILIYDSNAVTLDAMAKETQSEDTAKRFEAIGFDVQTHRRARDGGLPRGVRARQERGQRQAAAHHRQDAHRQGHPRGRRHAEGARRGRREVRRGRAQGARAAGGALLRVARGDARSSPSASKELDARLRRLDEDVRGVEGDEPRARRAARGLGGYSLHAAQGHEVSARPTSPRCSPPSPSSPPTPRSRRARPGRTCSSRSPRRCRCSSAAAPISTARRSTTSAISKAGNDDFKPGHRTGRNIRFGIREHGMCSIMNGIAAHGIFRPSGATFLVFADYCRAADPPRGAQPPARHLRLHARQRRRRRGRAHPRAGGDHPRACASSRTSTSSAPPIPRRPPARGSRALDRTDGPTLLALTRQAVPLLESHPRQDAPRGRAQGRLRRQEGDRAARSHPARPPAARCSTRSRPRKPLGPGTRVVSMPCFARFDRQPAAYRDEVLPRVVPAARLHRGHRDVHLGAATSGSTASASASTASACRRRGPVMKELGITAESVVAAAKSL